MADGFELGLNPWETWSPSLVHVDEMVKRSGNGSLVVEKLDRRLRL
ncbi:MAG: hypothetical protein KIH01_01195 [Candidatus Freyarchaeota archaeon]|nr:hypothetical protein [Candidatus Jordarchaeia archaeon]